MRSQVRNIPLYDAVVAVAVVLGSFGLALLISRVSVRSAVTLFDVGEVGTPTRLLVSVLGVQVLGFGVVLGGYLWYRSEKWLQYLRVGALTQWTVFYGTAVGLGLMLIAVAATGVFSLLEIEAAESPVGQATDPSFYLLLFLLSTFVAVPMEELFFRGLLQRRLEESLHPAGAIIIASLLFVLIHTSVTVGSGGALIAVGMYLGFGILLGVSYYYTENLLVPIVGHAMFNGIQILVRALEVLF